MSTSLTVRNMRRESWALMLREQAASGLSVREWCRRNELSVKSFYYRRRQVQEMILDSGPRPVFAEVSMPQSADSSYADSAPGLNVGFVPRLTIAFGDVLISVDQNTPMPLLADIMKVIRNA